MEKELLPGIRLVRCEPWGAGLAPSRLAARRHTWFIVHLDPGRVAGTRLATPGEARPYAWACVCGCAGAGFRTHIEAERAALLHEQVAVK